MKLSIPMTPRQVLFGWLLMAGQLLILPTLAVTLNSFLPVPLSVAMMNILLFGTEFLLAILIFHKFLIASAKHAFRAPYRCLRYAVLGLVLYYIASYVIGLLIAAVSEDFLNFNDQTILQMVEENFLLIGISTVFLVPVTEELLYRGLIFRGLHHKSRLAAYGVSAMVFGMIHIVSYVGTASASVLLLSFLQYLPAGLLLGWAYEKADSIWAPILMHITINQISISLMR